MFTYYRQNTPDLFAGLALEEALLDLTDLPCPALFLWRSPPALVLGKNQNPWKECDLSLVREKGLLLGRRISGGGAVYHDTGNLNLSWFMDRRVYLPHNLHAWLRNALAQLGFDAETQANGSTFVSEHKVSGSAYCYRKNSVLHHVTLLLNADLPLLRAALRPPGLRMETHAVDSIPSPVANLMDLQPGLREPDLESALLSAAIQTFGPMASRPFPLPPIDRAIALLRSPEWIWGQTPAFKASLTLGQREITLRVRKGTLTELNGEACPSLPFDQSLPENLSELLPDTPEQIRRAFELSGWIWGASLKSNGNQAATPKAPFQNES